MKTVLARVSVIVPVGPGDSVSPILLGQLSALPPQSELYLVHADALDALSLRVPPPGSMGPRTRHIGAARGRATQQNAGAAAATRDWLWFLHADSQLASRTLPALSDFVQRDVAALGYFDLRFLADGPALMRINALGAHLRSRWLGLPFGDQGLILPRAIFESLGGFDPAVSCGEDHDLVWRARRAGVPLRAVGAPLFTSARKYAERGWWTTTAWHVRETWRQALRFSRAQQAP